MATFETTRPAPFGAVTLYRVVLAFETVLARVVSTFETVRDTLVEWNNKRVTRDALSRLSDRELADIGLSRSDAETL